jgi:hypothetical protein
MYQTVLSDTQEISSLRLVLAEKQILYQTVLSDTPEIRSLKPRLDRGEARAPSFSKECQSLWLYLPIHNHHASIPAQGIAGYEALRSNLARTSLRHLHQQDHIRVSAADFVLWSVNLPRYVSNLKAQRRGARAAHSLTDALKVETLCITINRKAETLPRLSRLTRQDQIERDGQLAVKLAVIDAVE